MAEYQTKEGTRLALQETKKYIDGKTQNLATQNYVNSKTSTALSDAKAYADQKISNLINSAPEALDTLGEIAEKLGENDGALEALLASVGENATAISTETQRAIGVENALQGAITTLDSNLSAEVLRATTTEKSISDSVASLQAYLNSLFEKETVNGETRIKALFPLYTTGWLSAFGANDNAPGGGSGIGNLLQNWATTLSDSDAKGSWALSAYLGKDLNTRLSSLGERVGTLEGGSATSIETTGNGNAITSVSKSGTKITFNKGATFLTQHQSLASYYTKTQVDSAFAKKATTLGGYGITDAKIANGVITLGSNTITPLTQHQDISGKVDKVTGKGLSTNDFTDILLTKLNGIESGANKYSLPTASSTTKGGVKVGSGLAISNEVLSVSLSASHIPSLDWSKITTGKPTTIGGYGITDAYTKTQIDTSVTALNGLISALDESISTEVLRATTVEKAISDTLNDMFEKKTEDGVTYIRAKYGIASDSFISAFGKNANAGGGGGAELLIDWNNYNANTASSLALGANLGKGLKDTISDITARVVSLEGGSALSISTTGSGNAITAISKSGTAITATKGATFLTSHQSLANYSTLANTIKSLAVNGTTITATRADGTVFTLTTQDTNTTYSAATQSANGLMSAADKAKLDGIASGANAYTLTKAAVEGVLTGNITSHTHSQYATTSQIPTTLPASDVYAWAKASTKPVYSWGEITGKPTTFTPSEHNHNGLYYTKSEADNDRIRAAEVSARLDKSLLSEITRASVSEQSEQSRAIKTETLLDDAIKTEIMRASLAEKAAMENANTRLLQSIFYSVFEIVYTSSGAIDHLRVKTGLASDSYITAMA